jgi:hypothetical protein
MVRIKVVGTQKQIDTLTKAAKHTGLSTPSKFLAAIFDGNYLPRRSPPSVPLLTRRPSISRKQGKP